MLKQQSLRLLLFGCVAQAQAEESTAFRRCTDGQSRFTGLDETAISKKSFVPWCKYDSSAFGIATPRRLSGKFNVRRTAADSNRCFHDVHRRFVARAIRAPPTRRSVLTGLSMIPFGAFQTSRMPAAAQAMAPSSAAKVLSLVESGMPRSDPELLAAVDTLIKDATPPATVDFADAAGTWRVVAAPLIDTLSRLALTKFDIQYRIGADSTIGASVRYNSKLVGDGWLCTDGTISNVADASTPTVKLVWERIWWKPGGTADTPPIDPDVEGAAFLRSLIQALGRFGFNEPLARFPVKFLDTSNGLAIFQWQSLTAVVQRVS
eukprot:gnl/TRDRNA2_/TRDRNA2_94961_c0_seq1.p1 gnl/TRDRNA2_/TRDRNA2_94961_c0~~gnl/TRDRNA2_/TRDRNA2_94961_c0_seq1.p1  ORF type:complete len:320 (+),score=44.88 gnl/TRDRNA2_/TRDRNA2_94961_c0_seq1:174-1133(+)